MATALSWDAEYLDSVPGSAADFQYDLGHTH